MIVNTEGRLPIKIFTDEITDRDRGAIEQAINLANLPFVYRWPALMPDYHLGYGMPIGGVMATQGVVVPNAVGVDIGCGMCALKTPWTIDDVNVDMLKEIVGMIRKEVPVGFNKHKKAQPDMPYDGVILHNFDGILEDSVVLAEWENAEISLGTLGGGNHFIEVQRDTEGSIWIMIHSGSRNLGTKVAKHYNDLAVTLNTRYFSGVPKEWELAFLPIDSYEGENYINEMEYCVEFAFANRKLMMERVAGVFSSYLKRDELSLDDMINIAHNYARMEHHFGKDVMVHRKGATSAKRGEVGIIPGSMGTKSYIVRGLGNPESFESCSHGAGRTMGRNEAKGKKKTERSLNLETEQKKMEGIVHGLRNVSDLDEAPGAYKDIDLVMENQKDLVKILVKLSPLAVVKG